MPNNVLAEHDALFERLKVNRLGGTYPTMPNGSFVARAYVDATLQCGTPERITRSIHAQRWRLAAHRLRLGLDGLGNRSRGSRRASGSKGLCPLRRPRLGRRHSPRCDPTGLWRGYRCGGRLTRKQTTKQEPFRPCHCSTCSPNLSGKPNIRFMFCNACEAAPFKRLSNVTVTTARVPSQPICPICAP